MGANASYVMRMRECVTCVKTLLGRSRALCATILHALTIVTIVRHARRIFAISALVHILFNKENKFKVLSVLLNQLKTVELVEIWCVEISMEVFRAEKLEM